MPAVWMPYGETGFELRLPARAAVLVGNPAPALADPERAVREALQHPVGCLPFRQLLESKRPRSVAITVSDSTRPVPNREFLPALLRALYDAGIADDRIAIVIGTGMHRASTLEERERILGPEILGRIAVIDHDAHDPRTMVQVCSEPRVTVCRQFAEAEFRIVTGFIEPHFMAGWSGGRKGVCPALVDLQTVQRFHGYAALANPLAAAGVLDGNPCHEIALRIARIVGVDFLLNVGVSADQRIAGVFCGDLEAAHAAGCRQVEEWATARVASSFDLVVTSGGGAPLDASFYQAVKGQVGALPALERESTLLQVAACSQGLGSSAYSDLLLRWGQDWRGFLAFLAAHPDDTAIDQWELQMQARVLEHVGVERLWFASDGVPEDVQRCIAVTPVLGPGGAAQRAQRAIDRYLALRPQASVAVIPDGPYTLLRRG